MASVRLGSKLAHLTCGPRATVVLLPCALHANCGRDRYTHVKSLLFKTDQHPQKEAKRHFLWCKAIENPLLEWRSVRSNLNAASGHTVLGANQWLLRQLRSRAAVQTHLPHGSSYCMCMVSSEAAHTINCHPPPRMTKKRSKQLLQTWHPQCAQPNACGTPRQVQYLPSAPADKRMAAYNPICSA